MVKCHEQTQVPLPLWLHQKGGNNEAPNKKGWQNHRYAEDAMKTHADRFSGHESFVCRYGWLPKVYAAVKTDSTLLRNEESAMTVLGIGRNMVKSLQFWAEATGVLKAADGGGHEPGPVGVKLFGGNDAWDPYLESLESLWLIHPISGS